MIPPIARLSRKIHWSVFGCTMTAYGIYANISGRSGMQVITVSNFMNVKYDGFYGYLLAYKNWEKYEMEVAYGQKN